MNEHPGLYILKNEMANKRSEEHLCPPSLSGKLKCVGGGRITRKSPESMTIQVSDEDVVTLPLDAVKKKLASMLRNIYRHTCMQVDVASDSFS